MTEGELKEVSRRLDVLIQLLAFSLVEGKKRRDQLLLLWKAGFQPKQIAEMLDTTPNTVSVELSKLRKRRGKRVRVKREEKAP